METKSLNACRAERKANQHPGATLRYKGLFFDHYDLGSLFVCNNKENCDHKLPLENGYFCKQSPLYDDINRIISRRPAKVGG
jgi:hypothetical protein